MALENYSPKLGSNVRFACVCSPTPRSCNRGAAGRAKAVGGPCDGDPDRSLRPCAGEKEKLETHRLRKCLLSAP